MLRENDMANCWQLKIKIYIIRSNKNKYIYIYIYMQNHIKIYRAIRKLRNF